MLTVAETMMIVEMMTGECFGEIEKGLDRTGMRKRLGSGVWEVGPRLGGDFDIYGV